MIGFIQRLPGAIIDLVADHPVIASALGLTVLAVAYIAALKVKLAADDARDVRNRNKGRW